MDPGSTQASRAAMVRVFAPDPDLRLVKSRCTGSGLASDCAGRQGLLRCVRRCDCVVGLRSLVRRVRADLHHALRAVHPARARVGAPAPPGRPDRGAARGRQPLVPGRATGERAAPRGGQRGRDAAGTGQLGVRGAGGRAERAELLGAVHVHLGAQTGPEQQPAGQASGAGRRQLAAGRAMLGVCQPFRTSGSISVPRQREYRWAHSLESDCAVLWLQAWSPIWSRFRSRTSCSQMLEPCRVPQTESDAAPERLAVAGSEGGGVFDRDGRLTAVVGLPC